MFGQMSEAGYGFGSDGLVIAGVSDVLAGPRPNAIKDSELSLPVPSIC